jgi:hypothetical protein
MAMAMVMVMAMTITVAMVMATAMEMVAVAAEEIGTLTGDHVVRREAAHLDVIRPIRELAPRCLMEVESLRVRLQGREG